jgi:N6-adenosine-specific RNA methylase IME4
MANENMNIIGAGQDTARPAPKKYKTIVADPPWQVKAGRNLGGYVVENGKQVFDQTHQNSRELAYQSMSVEEICALPVRDIAEENAHLYVWTINRYVEQAYQVARAWGFTPSTMLVWAKTPFGGGLGGAYGISTEFVLFCRRGTLPALSKVVGTWWNWKRHYVNGYPCHSKKPEQFQDMVETVSPGPYLEMFARRVRNGWDAWGNEIEESPVILLQKKGAHYG